MPIHRARRRIAGFSLLEVLVAVVVLATGLLAVAALQGRLTQSSADAKVRGRIAALLAAHMDELRQAGYGAIVATAYASDAGNPAHACDPATLAGRVHCAREQSALATLGLSQAVQTFAGAVDFAEGVPAGPLVAQFKRVTLTATWSDSAGNARQLGVASDVSALGLTNLVIPPPDDLETGGATPVVRTIDPATAGVIPIAMSATSTSATSNPVPELVGQGKNQEIVGTKFNVLNYTPPDGGAVIIQKRFENELVKCRCQYGAGGDNLRDIYRTAQWPAIWTGQRYEVHAPASDAAAPGQARSAGPQAGVKQSALCQECCRDHHDTGAAGEVRFDPERTDGQSKYDVDAAGNLVAVTDPAGGRYVNACRVIRVDGFWRTASDLYARQFGLLETEPENGVAARSGLPTSGAVSLYTGFVKDFLGQYKGSSGDPPSDAQADFVANTGFDVPAMVTIEQPSNIDYRYLHGRGLYVDHLEEKARKWLVDALADTEPGGLCHGISAQECVLPYLPFTTANLTEIADWKEVASVEGDPPPGVLSINAGNLLATDPAEPSGGRTIGQAVGTAGNRGSMRRSNSGVAVSSVLKKVSGVDPADAGDLWSDTQPFEVTGTSNGLAFDVRVAGGGANPFVFFTLATDVDRECFKPLGADHHCVTVSGTVLPQAGTVRVANYWMETSTGQQVTATCNGTVATATIDVPTFHDFEAVSAAIGAASGAIDAPANDGTMFESTTLQFPAIDENDLVAVALAEEAGSPTYATVASCSTNAAGTEINDVVWDKAWD